MTDGPDPKAQATDAKEEIESGKRFGFGGNWRAFLHAHGEAGLSSAGQSLRALMGPALDAHPRLLDAGSGSGLFSAAAALAGANVVSFDYDPESVECTRQAKARWGASLPWEVHQASLLDASFLDSLSEFDLVYCWGVAHHTGAMWSALANLVERVKPGGRLAISIYNDQGRPSRRWLVVKRLYNQHRWLRPLLLAGAFVRLWGVRMLRDTLSGHPLKSWREYCDNSRGMSAWHDLVDWVGGYPFEVARPEQIFEFFTARGFELLKLKTCAGGIGCNEYVFQRRE